MLFLYEPIERDASQLLFAGLEPETRQRAVPGPDAGQEPRQRRRRSSRGSRRARPENPVRRRRRRYDLLRARQAGEGFAW